MTSERDQAIKINCPELFRDPAFAAWLNRQDRSSPIATWYVPGTPPGEYADVFMTFEDSGEAPEFVDGSDSDMPEPCWTAIVEHCRSVGFRCGLIQLTNLPE